MLGFHLVIAMGCGNKCQRAGGDAQRPSPITENYLLLPKVVFEPSGLHLRCDWIMARWHTPLMELSQRRSRTASAAASKELRCFCQTLASADLGPGWKMILLAVSVIWGNFVFRCQEKQFLSFHSWKAKE